MREGIAALLTSRDVTISGLLIVIVAVLAIAFHRSWLVSGPRYKECQESGARCKSVLSTARIELEECESHYEEARIAVVRYEEREFVDEQAEDNGDDAPPPIPQLEPLPDPSPLPTPPAGATS